MLNIRKIKCKKCGIADEVATSLKGKVDYTCSDCTTSHIYSTFTPSWVSTRIEPDKMDAEHDTKVTEAMVTQRTKEMRTSAQARSWEQGRKAEMLKFKPQWVKRGRRVKDLPR